MTNIKQAMTDSTARRYLEVELEIGTARIRSLTQREFGIVESKPADEKAAWYVAFCQVDEKGNRIWADEELSTIQNIDVSNIIELWNAITDHVLPESVREPVKN